MIFKNTIYSQKQPAQSRQPMRSFIAIDLSPDMKKSLVTTMHDFKLKGLKGNFTPSQNLHLTLCFIGETKDKDLIIEALKSIKYKPFKLTTADLGNFGDLLYIGTRGGQAINTLVTDIRNALKDAGISFDTQKFVPHVTLVRKAAGMSFKQKVPKSEMMVKKISLMKSETVKGKVVYTEIWSF